MSEAKNQKIRQCLLQIEQLIKECRAALKGESHE